MVNASPRSSSDIDAEAAAWLARLHGPYRSAASDAALKSWLKADAAHQDAFERATEIWDMIPGVTARPGSDRSETRHPRRPVLAGALALLLLLVVGGGALLVMRPPIHETTVGGQQIVMLSDGTRVSLNTNSRIAVLYSAGERRIRLDRGEALFEVAHNPARPFVVEAGAEQIRALGTTFLVRRDGEAKVAVTLLEGRIDVSSPGGVAGLSPGERLTVTPTAGAALDRPSIDTVAAWRRGEIVFDDTSLLEAAEELNRYSRSQVIVADPSLAALRISGVFSTGDIAEVAEAVAALHRLRATRDGDTVRLTRD